MNIPATSNESADSPEKNEASAEPTPEDPNQVTEQDKVAEPPKICLDQFLKTCGVETGGQAKRLIQGGEVLVNNELETRRRRKLVPGDEVQLYEDIFIVALAADLDATELESVETEAAPADSTETE